jgi:hypothetical protein
MLLRLALLHFNPLQRHLITITWFILTEKRTESPSIEYHEKSHEYDLHFALCRLCPLLWLQTCNESVMLRLLSFLERKREVAFVITLLEVRSTRTSRVNYCPWHKTCFTRGYFRNEKTSFNSFLAEPKKNAEAIFKTYELFMDGDLVALLINSVKMFWKYT